MSSCKDPPVADDRAPAEVSLTGQPHLQADLPRPLARGRVCPSHDPDSSCRMLHTHYGNNSKLCLKIICTFSTFFPPTPLFQNTLELHKVFHLDTATNSMQPILSFIVKKGGFGFLYRNQLSGASFTWKFYLPVLAFFLHNLSEYPEILPGPCTIPTGDPFEDILKWHSHFLPRNECKESICTYYAEHIRYPLPKSVGWLFQQSLNILKKIYLTVPHCTNLGGESR